MHQGKQSLFKDLVQYPFSRRSFFKLGAALGGTAALAGCGSAGLRTVSVSDWNRENLETAVIPTASCHNCGGRLSIAGPC